MVEGTADGIAALFEAECIQQRSLRWAREKMRSAIAGCGELFDCEYHEAATVASWQVKTSTGAAPRLTLWFPLGLPDQFLDTGNPPDRVTCVLKAGNDIGPMLREAAQQAAARASLAAQPIHSMDGSSQTWIWAHAGGGEKVPRIELYYEPELTSEAGMTSNPAPWELRYAVFMPGPGIWR